MSSRPCPCVPITTDFAYKRKAAAGKSPMAVLAKQAKSLLGFNLLPAQVQKFNQLSELLLDWNQRMNLTAIKDPAAIAIKHYLDSLTLIEAVPCFEGRRLIDVGAGAGFPGLALAIAFPNLHVTFLDSTAKKLRFVDHVGQTLGLKNIRTLHARAEDAGRHPDHRGAYDIVATRAVARMPVLMEYTLPFAKLAGRVIAMQGSSAYEATSSAAKAISKLGGELFAIEEIKLPTLDHPRYLVVIDKIEPTPAPYPRSAGAPARRPIQ